MIMKIFSVYDSKAEAYLPPFFFASTGQAVRAFADNCNEENSMLCKHPEDYTLFELGTWDDANAMVLIAEHRSLGKAIEYRTIPMPH